jgi:hypothetical protein
MKNRKSDPSSVAAVRRLEIRNPKQNRSSKTERLSMPNHPAANFHHLASISELLNPKSSTKTQTMKTRASRTIVLMTALLACGSLNLCAQVPGIISYQGRVQVSTTNFTGTGQFKFALVDPGTNAVRQATATVTAVNGFIVAVTPTDVGYGYVTAPTITITDPFGSNAVVTANVSGGAVVSFNILSNGRNYSVSPTVSLTPPPPSVVYATYWSNDGTSTGGGEPGGAVATTVSQGLFTIALGDTNLPNMTAIPSSVFIQPNVHLRLWFSDGAQGFQRLTPDQRVGSVGYAMVAESLSAALSSSGLSGAYFNAVSFANADNSFTGNGAGLTALNADELAAGTVPDARLAANVARINQVWLLGGNSGTTGGTHFLGSTDNQPVEFKVNGLRALRLEANSSNSVNVVAGAPWNAAGPGAVGVTIGGGGAVDYGGVPYTNRADADFGTIAGGGQNVIQTTAYFASIGGGEFNSIQYSARGSVIGGGGGNSIMIATDYGTIAGGHNNRIEQAADNAALAGGLNNYIGTNADYAAIGGGVINGIAADSASATIAGGYGNLLGPNAGNSTIGGGNGNIIAADSEYATIAGGASNDIGTNADYSLVGGGYDNNIAAKAEHATIAGGTRNDIGTNADYSAIGGGYDNNIATDAGGATIAGGISNEIGTNSQWSTIGGGSDNTITANGLFATIPGGRANVATNYAFAAGYRAKANHTGAFVWGDSNNADIASTNANSVTMRASGGYRLFANSGATVGAYLEPGGGSWTSMSDRTAKENFAAVDTRAVLDKVTALPLSTWNYKSQDAKVRHIGPMAQDFKAAFGVGGSDTGITSVDADGVALAAIQGLNEKLECRMQNAEVRSRRLEAENTALKQELAELKALVQTLAEKMNGGGQ